MKKFSIYPPKKEEKHTGKSTHPGINPCPLVPLYDMLTTKPGVQGPELQCLLKVKQDLS